MDEKFAQFLAQTLDYLPANAKSTAQQKQTHNTSMSPGILAAKQETGYLQPPSDEELARLHAAEQQQQIQLAQADFYSEVDEKKRRSTEKIIKVLKYNPFIPLGCLVTVGVLMNGVYAMRMKDRHKSQRMMRYRVAAQGSTVIALVIGTIAANYLAIAASEETK